MKSLFLFAFLAGGLLLVHSGALPFGVWALMALLVIVVRLLPGLDPYKEVLRIDDDGITRQHGSRLRKQMVEKVRWDDLRKVEVRTRETGPAKDQMLFLLYGSDVDGVAVPGPVAQQHALPQALAARLPGWREDLLAQAEAATGPMTLTLWETPSQ